MKSKIWAPPYSQNGMIITPRIFDCEIGSRIRLLLSKHWIVTIRGHPYYPLILIIILKHVCGCESAVFKGTVTKCLWFGKFKWLHMNIMANHATRRRCVNIFLRWDQIWKPEYQKLDGLFSLGSVSIHIATIQITLATAQQKAKTTATNTLNKQKATH